MREIGQREAQTEGAGELEREKAPDAPGEPDLDLSAHRRGGQLREHGLPIRDKAAAREAGACAPKCADAKLESRE